MVTRVRRSYAPTMDDHELVARLRAGDEGAFATLVRRHQPSLLRLAESLVGSRAVAEEVVQDTWLAVCKGADSFEERSSLKTWIYSILVNRARSTATREKRSQPIDGDEYEGCFDSAGVWETPPIPWSEKVDDQMVAKQFARLVAKVLPSLPDAQQQVLMLRDVEGLPPAVVSTLLSISDGNQRVLLHRARCRIRQHLENAMGGEWS